MTSALIVGDVHLTDDARRPRARIEGYTEHILDKLKFCVEKANELDVPLIQAGDVFHLKPSAKNSHALIQRTHDILKKTNRDVWIVPGNHDMQNDRLDSLAKQPLGSLSKMDGMHLLVGHREELPGIAGIPYLTEFDGGNWQPKLDEWIDKCISLPPDLVVTHAPLFPPGEEPGVYFNIPAAAWAERMNIAQIKATYYGHIHECHGTFTVEGHQFCNQGALSRGSLHEKTLTRKPSCTLWSGGDFTRIEVPHLPSEEVFLLAEAEQAASNKASALEFAEALGSTQLTSLTFENISAILREQVKDKAVLTAIENILEEIR